MIYDEWPCGQRALAEDQPPTVSPGGYTSDATAKSSRPLGAGEHYAITSCPSATHVSSAPYARCELLGHRTSDR